MCCGCWKEYGSPKIKNEKVFKAIELIEEVYEHSISGGNLHVQLDDNNIEDHFFEKYEIHRDNTTAEQENAERICFEWMKLMTEKERVSALGLRDGCFK